MFTTDSDLVRYEPRLFDEVRFAAQHLGGPSSATLNDSGTTLTGLQIASGVTPAGLVVLVDGVPYEVTSAGGQDQLLVTLLRPWSDGGDIAIERDDDVDVTAEVYWFGPQRAEAYRQVLGMLGLRDPGSSGDGPTASDVVNPAALVPVEAFLSLHLIYASASALLSDQSVLWQKAMVYRERFGAERRRVSVEVDLDGDGVADATRRPGVMHLVRR